VSEGWQGSFSEPLAKADSGRPIVPAWSCFRRPGFVLRGIPGDPSGLSLRAIETIAILDWQCSAWGERLRPVSGEIESDEEVYGRRGGALADCCTTFRSKREEVGSS
jgi:hypothetical protein